MQHIYVIVNNILHVVISIILKKYYDIYIYVSREKNIIYQCKVRK